MLGESVKVSRGMISGIAKDEDGNRFQIDAKINPGNSGGPVVDSRPRGGRRQRMLIGDEIDSVGLVIPSNEAAALLKEKQFAVSDRTSRQRRTRRSRVWRGG